MQIDVTGLFDEKVRPRGLRFALIGHRAAAGVQIEEIVAVSVTG